MTARPFVVGSGGSSTAIPTLTIPPTARVGDVLLLVTHSQGGQTITAPTGWTETPDSPQTVGTGIGSSQLATFTRVFVAGDSLLTIGDSGDHNVGQIYVIRGADRDDPFDVTSGGTEATVDTSLSVTGDTTTENDTLVVVAVGQAGFDGANPFTWDSPVAVFGSFSFGAGTGGQIDVGYVAHPTAGAYGPYTGTYTTATSKAFITLAFRPAPEPFLLNLTTQNSTAGFSPAWPAGHLAGDIGLLIVETAATQGITTPDGWTEVPASPQESGGTTSFSRLAAYWFRATSNAETAPAVSDSGTHQFVAFTVFGNCVASGSPIDASAGTAGASGTDHTIPGITTTVASTLVVDVIVEDASQTNSGWTNADLTEVTEVFDTGVGGSVTATIAIAVGRRPTAGAVGTTAVTSTLTTATASIKLALKPPATAGGGVSVAPAPASLTLTALTPTVTASNHVTIAPAPASLTLTPVAPVVGVSDHQAVTPAPASLVLTTAAPTVTASDHITVAPAAAALVLATFAPSVTGGAGLTLHPAPASLSLTAFAPDVVLTDHQIVIPGPAALVLTTFAPDVVAVNPQVVTPGPASMVLTTFAPTVVTAMPAFIPRGSVATVTVPTMPGATVTVPVPVASVAVPELPTAEVT